MNILLLSLIILGFSINSFAVIPPSQDVVDKYVEMALSINEQKLSNEKGKFQCSFDFPEYSGMNAKGKSYDEAIQKLQLICIKHQCETLGEKVNQSMKNLASMPDSDLRDFLEFNHMSKDEIERTLRAIRDNSIDKGPTQNCLNGPAHFRQAAFDFCFATPVGCHTK
jgi:hypothetical protein